MFFQGSQGLRSLVFFGALAGTIAWYLTEHRINTRLNMKMNEFALWKKDFLFIFFVCLKAHRCDGAMECDYRCFCASLCVLVPSFSDLFFYQRQLGLSPCYIPCRLAWSEAFICICSCWPSVTTTACASRPVSERQQLKGKVVFVRSCQMQSKTHFRPAVLLFPSNPLSTGSLALLHTSQRRLLASVAAPRNVCHVHSDTRLHRVLGLKQETEKGSLASKLP